MNWRAPDVLKSAVLGFALITAQVVAVVAVAATGNLEAASSGIVNAAWFACLLVGGFAITWLRPAGYLSATITVASVMLLMRWAIVGSLAVGAELTTLLTICGAVAAGETFALVVRTVRRVRGAT